MTTLNQALDLAVQLPFEQQEMLIDILRQRQIEARRQEIALAAQEGLKGYHRRELQPQSALDAIHELNTSLQSDEESTE